MLSDLAFLFALVLLNGVFAMSEIAVVGSKRGRLMALAGEGHAGAKRALALMAEPTRFLSTVQVGITTVGILSGAIGEATIAARLRAMMEQVPAIAPYAHPLSIAAMVSGLAYVSLIFGELVPKRLALTRPERIAGLIARPMQTLAAAARPLISLLSVSTDGILRLLRVRTARQPAVTLEEFKLLVEQGTAEGIFEKTERELVTNVLDLDERRVGAILTPRSEIVFINVREPFERTRDTLTQNLHSVLPVCDGGLDRVLGFVRSRDVLSRVLKGERVDFEAIASAPVAVPKTITLMTLLEQFKRSHTPLVLVVNEFGDVDGLVSLADVMTAIVGDLPAEPGEEPMVIRREDGSWLLDGMLGVDAAARTLGIDSLALDERENYHTIGGLAMFALGRVPRTGDVFQRKGFRFEIVDMDGNRVDRVLVTPMRRASGDAPATARTAPR
jgi:putative hemolysin